MRNIPKLKLAHMKRKSGQILILILLIVVVSLAVGLSVASRNITNLRTSTQAEHSQRALSAAEGGVEEVLSRLSTVASQVPVGGSATIDVQQIGEITPTVIVTASNIYESTIEPGEIGQVDLDGAIGTIQIEWVKKPTEESTPASVEVTLVNKDPVSGEYSQVRKAWAGGHPESAGNEEGFVAPTGSSLDYKLSESLSVGAGPVLLRVKPFWARTTVRVTCSSGCTLPTQTYDVVSEAQTEIGVTRKIQVTRTALPQLPAAFDYVLYSEGLITK